MQSESLDVPITQEEVKSEITSMKPGKSPGADGLPSEYYKMVYYMKVLPGIIHKDQVGFIKGRSSADNVQRLIHLMWLNASENTPITATCLDDKKAFDRVEWGFLTTVLSNFRFGHIFRTWVSLLYKNPRAAVMTNVMTSPV